MNDAMRFNMQEQYAKLPVEEDTEMVEEKQSGGMEEAVTQNPIAMESNRVNDNIASAFTLQPDVVQSVFVGNKPQYSQRPVYPQDQEQQSQPQSKKPLRKNIMLDKGLKLFD